MKNKTKNEKTRISEEEADDVLDFIVQKTGLLDKVVVKNIGSTGECWENMKNIYIVQACFSYYKALVKDLTYERPYGCPVKLKSKLYASKFCKVAARRALSKLMQISSKGHDVFCGDVVVLKKNTTLEQLLVEKDLASYNKE